jgi:hypothetical protein
VVSFFQLMPFIARQVHNNAYQKYKPETNISSGLRNEISLRNLEIAISKFRYVLPNVLPYKLLE